MDDKKHIIGTVVSDELLKRLANEVKLNTDFKLFPQIETLSIEGKQCIQLTIEESPLKPHLAYGRAFKRVGPTNQRLDKTQYDQMLSSRYNGYGFDYQTQKKASLKDIDTDALLRFVEQANRVRSLNENLLLDPKDLLEKLDLSKNGVLTHAALLLFGNKPQKFFEQHYEIKCGIFPENEGYDHILKQIELKGNLLENFELLFHFITEHLPSSLIKNKLEHSEQCELPPDALREALINMIVHRDYRVGIKSTVEIRPGWISFYNPAQFFDPTMNAERLKKTHPSRPGNKLLAKVFYQLGLFENWGSGTLKIIDAMAKAGKKEPEFEIADGMFLVEAWAKEVLGNRP